MIVILLVGCFSDQISKKWAARHLKNQPTYTLINHVIELGYTENHGMVFGINNRQDNDTSRTILLIIRIILSIGLTIYLFINWRKSLLFHLPFLLILSGAIGNVIDSFRFSHVIDFIHLHLGNIVDWPFLFNLADAYVCIGMGIFLLQSFLSQEHVKTTAKNNITVQASTDRTEV